MRAKGVDLAVARNYTTRRIFVVLKVINYKRILVGMANHQTTIIVLSSGLSVAISMGLRQSFGLFMQPVSQGGGAGP